MQLKQKWPSWYPSEILFWILLIILTFLIDVDDMGVFASLLISLAFVSETFAIVQVHFYLVKRFLKNRIYWVYFILLILLLLIGVILTRQTFFWIYGERGSNPANFYFILIVGLTYLIRVINEQKKNFTVKKIIETEEAKSFFVQSGTTRHQIYFDEIIYLKAEGNYISIHTINKTRIMTLMTMKQVLMKLPLGMFCRIHKSFIISIPKISSVENHQVSIDKHTIPIGNVYREEFFKLID